MSFLITIFAISFIIFVHECGHLFFAKLGGIGCIEFSVGMGPRLFGFTYKGTVYNLRLFPLGGFVKLAGLDDSESELDPSCYYQNRPLIYRFLTISAGSLMNVLLGYLLFFILVFFMGMPEVSSTIHSVEKGSPAYHAGLMAEDRLLSLDGQVIEDVRQDFIDRIKDQQSPVNIQAQRGGSIETFEVAPFFDEENAVYRIGVQLDIETEVYSFFNSLGAAAEMTGRTISMVFLNLKMVFSGGASLKDLSGPVGIVQVASFQLSQGIASFLSLMALITITLGLINLFPIPVLDGGHLLFLLYEAVFRKPVPPRVAIVLNNFFALLLITLMVFVIVNDFRFWTDRVEVLDGLSSD